MLNVYGWWSLAAKYANTYRNDCHACSQHAGTAEFWQISAVSPDADSSGTARKLLADSDTVSPAVSPGLTSVLESSYPGMHMSPWDTSSMHAGTRALQQTPAEVPATVFRNNINFALDVVFYNEDRSTMLTPDVIAQVKEIEDEIVALPQYELLCLHAITRSENGQFDCRRPISYTNVVYGRFDNGGNFIADGSADIQQDPVKAAQVPLLPDGCFLAPSLFRLKSLLLHVSFFGFNNRGLCVSLAGRLYVTQPSSHRRAR